MAKNKVQFQKSMTIHAFMNKFGSEAQCRKQLFRIRWPNGSRIQIISATVMDWRRGEASC